MSKERPTREEIEFHRAELEVFMQRYGLEGIDYVLDRVLTTIKNMIKQGEVPVSEEGVHKAMSLIVSAHPEIEQLWKKGGHNNGLNANRSLRVFPSLSVPRGCTSFNKPVLFSSEDVKSSTGAIFSESLIDLICKSQ